MASMRGATIRITRGFAHSRASLLHDVSQSLGMGRSWAGGGAIVGSASIINHAQVCHARVPFGCAETAGDCRRAGSSYSLWYPRIACGGGGTLSGRTAGRARKSDLPNHGSREEATGKLTASILLMNAGLRSM